MGLREEQGMALAKMFLAWRGAGFPNPDTGRHRKYRLVMAEKGSCPKNEGRQAQLLRSAHSQTLLLIGSYDAGWNTKPNSHIPF